MPTNASRGGRRAEAILIATVGWGLAFGFCEVAILGVQRHVFERFIWTPGPFTWMTPVSYVILFLPLGGLMAVASLIRPRWGSPFVATVAFGGVGIFGLLTMLRAIHPLALLVLAFGLATVVARIAVRHPSGWRRLCVGGGIGLSALWALALGVDVATREGNDRYQSPTADEDAPSVLLIVWDTVRSASMSIYGYDRPTTPFLERLAERGVLFERSISTAPWTLPALSTLLTGLDARELSSDWLVPLDGSHVTLGEFFRHHGYHTASFNANWAYGDAEKGLARGFDTYVDHRLTPSQLVLSSQLGQTKNHWHTAWQRTSGVAEFLDEITLVHAFPGRMGDRRFGDDINREFLSWLERKPDGPFFAFLNYMDAHDPYYAPDDLLRRFRRSDPLIDDYDAAIAHLDRTLERLLRSLEQSGHLDNTIVAITSDHGELLGEQGLTGHGHSLYLPLLQVPLLIVGAENLPEGLRVSEPVSLRHVPRTLIDLTGLPAGAFPGHSLSGLWTAGPRRSYGPVLSHVRQGFSTGEVFPVTHGDMSSILTDRHHLIVGGGPGIELFDYVADPEETRNLVHDSDVETLLSALRGKLNPGPVP